MRDDSGMQDVQYTEVNSLLNLQYARPTGPTSQRDAKFDYTSTDWFILKTLIYVDYFFFFFYNFLCFLCKNLVSKFMLLFSVSSYQSCVYLFIFLLFCCFPEDWPDGAERMPGTPHRGAATYSSYRARNNVASTNKHWCTWGTGPADNEFGYKEHWANLFASNRQQPHLVLHRLLLVVIGTQCSECS